MYIVIIKHDNRVGNVYIGPFNGLMLAKKWAEEKLLDSPLKWEIEQIFPQNGHADKINYSEF